MRILGEIKIKVRYAIEGTSPEIGDFIDVLDQLAEDHHDLAVGSTIQQVIWEGTLDENNGVVSVDVIEIEVE